jgi:phage baseplate assembly protein W
MSTTSPYGWDKSCIDDLDPAMIEVGGNLILAQACARRLSTPRGQLIDDRNYGYDLKQWLGQDVDPAQIAQIRSGIASELLKDERVLAVTAVAVFVASTEILTVSAVIQGATGPFTLVLSVGAVTVQILQAA